jgi:hypothetical protein
MRNTDIASLLVGPLTLAAGIRRGPPAPLALATSLGNLRIELEFRALVRRVLPTESSHILARTPQRSGDGTIERIWAFTSAFERAHFPLYELEELEWLLAAIPFQRMGWSYDAFHDLDLGTGTLLLRCLCEEPYEDGLGARVPLLEAVERRTGLARKLLQRLPNNGFKPAELHRALDQTRFAAAAEFADWTWGMTELACLDFDDEIEIADAEWTDDNIDELTRQWKLASALMDRVGALETWLEQSPSDHFTELLEAVLMRMPPATATGGAHAEQPESNDTADERIAIDFAIPAELSA